MKCPNCGEELFFVSVDKVKSVHFINDNDYLGDQSTIFGDTLDTLEAYLECTDGCEKKFNFEYKTEDYGIILKDERKE